MRREDSVTAAATRRSMFLAPSMFAPSAGLTWQGLKDAVDGTAAQGAPMTKRMRVTALQASIVSACGLRPKEHLRSGDKEPIAVRHVAFHPRTEDLPFGALEIRVKSRKAAVATGVGKDEFHSVWAEPPCQELDFVSQLKTYIAENEMGPEEPVFASLDANGYRKRLGHAPGVGCVAIYPREYNANFKELMARAGVFNASARSTRRGFATSLAEEAQARWLPRPGWTTGLASAGATSPTPWATLRTG